MKATTENEIPQGNLLELVQQGKSLFAQLERELRPGHGWIGAGAVLHNAASNGVDAAPYTGDERRNGKAVTLAQLCNRLKWREADVAAEARRGTIWGAHKIGNDWLFDPVELRAWFAAKHNGEIRIHV